MGTTLTGTTPQDTYDSLIKVTDNGPLSGTLKTLTDGLGNDSALALSTGAASITGTLAVSGNATFDTNTLYVDATNNRVGIGITTPDSKVRIQNDNATVPSLTIRDGGTPTVDHIRVSSGTYGDAFFVGATGNVGIGTSSPASKLVIVSDDPSQVSVEASTGNTNSQINLKPIGTGIAYIKNQANTDFAFGTNNTERIRILAAGGLTFNGDTAAANALDDYEEGTWTMGLAFGGASTGITYRVESGATYTKIGRQVTVTGFIELTSKGSATGTATITGLPFAVNGSGWGFFGAAACRLTGVSFSGQYALRNDIGGTILYVQQTTEAGVSSLLDNTNFVNDSTVMITLTYFV